MKKTELKKLIKETLNEQIFNVTEIQEEIEDLLDLAAFEIAKDEGKISANTISLQETNTGSENMIAVKKNI